MIRALEVYEISGKPISSFHNEKNLKNDYQILKFGLRTIGMLFTVKLIKELI